MTCLVIAGLVVIAGHALRYIWLSNIKRILWSDFSKNLLKSTSSPQSPILNAAPNTQVDCATLPIVGTGATLSHAQIKYQIFPFLNLDSGNPSEFRLDYLVLAVPLNKSVPHLFIDGRKQNSFTAKNPNLWSLPKRIRFGQKTQDLEGDFYKSFRVYAADKKQVETLSILTPDTMLALRDQGYEFDYELYNGYLYVISEPSLSTPESYEAFITAAKGALQELIPQISKHSFDSQQTTLRTGNFKMYVLASLYSSMIIIKWVVFVSVSVLITMGIGTIIQS